MSGMPKRATITDVAKESGFSISTVSRVLSNADYTVASETREKILAAARKMNYIPNIFGQNLKKNNSNVVGVVLPNITNPYYAQLLQTIEDEAMQLDKRLIFCSAHRQPELEVKCIEMLLHEQVAGILLSSIDRNSTAARFAISAGANLVTLEQKLPILCSHIGFDYAEGAYIAVEHLIRRGHTKIAFVGAPIDRFSRYELLQGYHRAFGYNDLPCPEEYIWKGIDEADTTQLYELENGKRCCEVMLELPSPPTAYFCINDLTAISLIHELQTRGLNVPNDVSVIGFDDIFLGQINDPPLSTIKQHTEELGKLAFKQINEMINNPDAPTVNITLRPELILRSTVK